MWNHKWGNNSTAARLIVMVIYWLMLGAEYIMHSVLVFTAGGRPQERSAQEDIHKFSLFIFTYCIHKKSTREGNVSRIPSDKIKGLRWQPSLPSSVLRAPQHRCCSSSLGCSRQLQGPDLHYWDRALTAQTPCSPYPNRLGQARQYTLAQLPVYCMQTACS